MLYYNSVSKVLMKTLELLIASAVFKNFRLVGGTSLSLQIGHRESIDIDLFSDLTYGEIDFKAIDQFLEHTFPVCKHNSDISPGLGKSYAIGNSEQNTVKLDVFYTDSFIREAKEIDGIRLATIEEIIAMKIDVVQRKARKKDFWDLHALLTNYNIATMLALHKERYPYNHDEQLIIQNFNDFELAEGDFDPICFKSQHWDIVKLDLIDAVEEYLKDSAS